MLFIRAKDKLTLQGESRDGVLIHATNNESLNKLSGTSQSAGAAPPTGGRSVLMIEDADLLTIASLTLKNDTLRAAGQAEALYFNSDEGRLIVRNASLFSEQDTVQVKGYAWFYRTLIAGNVDFIWGYNRAALFEESEIRSLGDSAKPEMGGYVAQARTVQADDPGFVFLNSRLTHGAGPKGNDIPVGSTYLARSPGRPAMWDKVSYINCAMDEHIAPVGWWNQPMPNPAVGGWREFGSTDLAGKPLDVRGRKAGVVMSASEAAALSSHATIFSSFANGQGWNPKHDQ